MLDVVIIDIIFMSPMCIASTPSCDLNLPERNSYRFFFKMLIAGVYTTDPRQSTFQIFIAYS